MRKLETWEIPTRTEDGGIEASSRCCRVGEKLIRAFIQIEKASTEIDTADDNARIIHRT